MITNLHELFPDAIFDETAYHLSEFFMNLALNIESHYYCQITKYIKDNKPNYFDDDLIF